MPRYPLSLPTGLKRDAELMAQQQGVSLNQFILWAVSEKLGSLKPGLDDPAFPRITYRRGASGAPAPVLRGTGIRVQSLVVARRDWAMAPREIAKEYGIRLDQVKDALAFYQAHRREIDQAIESDRSLVGKR